MLSVQRVFLYGKESRGGHESPPLFMDFYLFFSQPWNHVSSGGYLSLATSPISKAFPSVNFHNQIVSMEKSREQSLQCQQCCKEGSHISLPTEDA